MRSKIVLQNHLFPYKKTTKTRVSRGMSEEMMVSTLENSDKEDEKISVGAGVVRIHSLHLKKKIINWDRYWKTADHCQPGHIRLNFPIETVGGLKHYLIWAVRRKWR
jgi:hypothetical protein